MPESIFEQLLNRQPDSHKYDYGHVLVIGGSEGMVGAPLMVGEAALRAGAGLVTLAGNQYLTDLFRLRVREIMTFAYSENLDEAAREIDEFCAKRKVSVIVFGPGYKVADKGLGLLPYLIEQSSACSLLIDGGGLELASRQPGLLDRNKDIILTPHKGEFEKLTGEKIDGQTQIEQKAEAFSGEHGQVTLVLKGHPTHIYKNAKLLTSNTSGGPALATAGSGDTLSGIIAGIVAQVGPTSEAVAAGVYLHGLAGDLAAQDKTVPAVIASDVTDYISAAYNQIQKQL